MCAKNPFSKLVVKIEKIDLCTEQFSIELEKGSFYWQ